MLEVAARRRRRPEGADQQRSPQERTANFAREERFVQLYHAHARYVRSNILKKVADPDKADEIVNATFTVAWRRMDVIPYDHTRTWLLVVASNILRNDRRAVSRAERFRRRLAAAKPCLGLEDHYPSEEILDGSSRATRALAGLRPADRMVLVLKVAGHDNDEMAKILGCSPGAVASRLSRARAAFRKCYSTSFRELYSAQPQLPLRR